VSDWGYCENRPCGRAFSKGRPHQRFCSANCRRESWAAKHQNAAQEAGERVRRPSREGKGTHIYLTPSEIDFLQHVRVSIRHKDDQQAQLNLGSKLAKAKARLR
jgi:hypothetical protein